MVLLWSLVPLRSFLSGVYSISVVVQVGCALVVSCSVFGSVLVACVHSHNTSRAAAISDVANCVVFFEFVIIPMSYPFPHFPRTTTGTGVAIERRSPHQPALLLCTRHLKYTLIDHHSHTFTSPHQHTPLHCTK